MSRLLAAAVATMIVLLLLTVPPDASARSDTRKVCSRSASVRDTPRGFVIARLYRNHKVRVLGRSCDARLEPDRDHERSPGVDTEPEPLPWLT